MIVGMWIVSFVSLSIVAVLCLVGVLHQGFKDNLLQCLGMSLLCVACFGRASSIWMTEITAGSWMLVHVGMALYALGTTQKVTLHNARDAGARWIARLDAWTWRRRTAHGEFDDQPHWKP